MAAAVAPGGGAAAAASPQPLFLLAFTLLVGAGAPLGAVNRIGLSPRELAAVVGAPAAERELACVAESPRAGAVLPVAHSWCGG